MNIHETSDSCSTDSVGGSVLTNGEERMEGAGRGERAETVAVTGESSLKEGTSRAGFDEGQRTSDNEGTESKEDQSGFGGCLSQNMDVKTFSSIGNDDPGSENVPGKTIHPALAVLDIGDDEMDDLDVVNEDSSQEAARSPTVSPDVLVQNNVPHNVCLNQLGLDVENVLPISKGQDDVWVSMRRRHVPISRAADESETIQRVVSCPGVLRREPNKDSDANLHSGGITAMDPQSEQQTRNRSRERADQQVVSPVGSLFPGKSEKTASEPPATPTKAPEVKVRQQDCCDTPRAESPISGNQPFQQNQLTQERERPGNKRDWSIRGAGASSNDEDIKSFTTQQSQMTQVEESPCVSPANEEQSSKVESGSLDDQTETDGHPNSDADNLEGRGEDTNQNYNLSNTDAAQVQDGQLTCVSPTNDAQSLGKLESESLDHVTQAEDCPNSDADELLGARNEDENQNSSQHNADVMGSTTPSAPGESVENAFQPPLAPTRALEVDVRREDGVNTARAGSSDSHLVLKSPIHSVRSERVVDDLQPTQDTVGTREANNEDSENGSRSKSPILSSQQVGCGDERNEISDWEEVLHANPEIARVQNQLRSVNNHFSLRTISSHAINLRRTSVLPCAPQIYSRLLDQPPEISSLDSMRNTCAHFTNRVTRTTIIPRARDVYIDYLQSPEQDAEKRNVNPTHNCNAFHIPNPGICVGSDSVNRSSSNNEEENDEREDENINIPNFYTVRERNDRVEAEPDIPDICLVCHELVGEHECRFAQHLTHAFVGDGMEMEGRAFNDNLNV